MREGKIRPLEQSVEALISAYRQLLAENEHLEAEALRWMSRATDLERERDEARAKATQLRGLLVNLTRALPTGPSTEAAPEGGHGRPWTAVGALRQSLRERASE